MSRPGSPSAGSPEGSQDPASAPGDLEGDTAEELPLSDPAHRTARWFMMLAPLILIIAVFLVLRLSTR